MNSSQKQVSNFQNKYKMHLSPVIRMIDIQSEVGELSKEILLCDDYGTKEWKVTEDLGSELGDVVFSLFALANSLKLDIDVELKKVFQKYDRRFKKGGNAGSDND
jgi:NTP pyrophosphatase (non-canonical NTP hydrolase)